MPIWTHKRQFTVIATPSLSKYCCDSSPADRAPAPHPACFPRSPWVLHHNAIVIHQIVCSHYLFTQPSCLLSEIILSLFLRPSPACCGPSAPLSDTLYSSPPFLPHTRIHRHTNIHTDTQKLSTPAVQLVSPGSIRCRPSSRSSEHKKERKLSALFPLTIIFQTLNKLNRLLSQHVSNHLDPPMWTQHWYILYVSICASTILSYKQY